MSKVKIALFSGLATVALSAVMSSSALALHEFKVEGAVLGATPVAIEAMSQTGYMETTVGGNIVHLECRDDYTVATSQIEEKGKSKARIEFSNCQVYEITGGNLVAEPSCVVTEPITAKATDELTGLGEDTFTGEGGTFAEIKIAKNASCPFATLAALTLKVKGSELCTFWEAGVEEVVHELYCTPGGSTLKAGESTEEPAKLWSTELLKTAGAKKWSAT